MRIMQLERQCDANGDVDSAAGSHRKAHQKQQAIAKVSEINTHKHRHTDAYMHIHAHPMVSAVKRAWNIYSTCRHFALAAVAAAAELRY